MSGDGTHRDRRSLDRYGWKLLSKYQIRPEDAQVAIDILACFLDVKANDPQRLMILPQIADWAWHEMVLDTRAHAAISTRKIHHARIDPDEQAFEQSVRLLRQDYGLRIPKRPEWQTTGWEDPRYRFRSQWLDAIAIREEHAAPLADGPGDAGVNWLELRLIERFQVSTRLAYAAVQSYMSSFETGMCRISTPEVYWAWQEHVLWTQRYERDCQTRVGRFIHYSVPSDTTFFVTGSVSPTGIAA